MVCSGRGNIVVPADTVTSINRLFLRTFSGYDSNRVSQCLWKHSPTTHEGSPGFTRDASVGDLGTAPFPPINIYLFNAVLSQYIVVVWIRAQYVFVDRTGERNEIFYEDASHTSIIFKMVCVYTLSLMRDGIIVSG